MIVLEANETSSESVLEMAQSVWETIWEFVRTRIWTSIRDYRFILCGLLILLIICIIIIYAKKHMPSKGRITDVYDATGERKDKKMKKEAERRLRDLPLEFYNKK